MYASARQVLSCYNAQLGPMDTVIDGENRDAHLDFTGSARFRMALQAKVIF
jgi:hypothetical protein